MNKTITLLLLTTSCGVSAAELFARPGSLCDALSSVGLQTSGWRLSQAADDEWACLSAPAEFGSAGADGAMNRLVFYVHGTSARSADEVLIGLDINNAAEREAAFSRLEQVTESLFHHMKERMPPALVEALSARESSTISASFGIAELTVDTGPVESVKLILRNVTGVEQRSQAAAEQDSDFAACREAISRAAGFSPSRLLGDNEPTQAAGQAGFMFMGKGKDLFFCEVHEGGHYRVKAALDGDFHFRYIADVQF